MLFITEQYYHHFLSSNIQKALAKPGVIRQGSGGEGNTDKVKVFLRIRPLTEGEKERGEDQVRSAL